MGQLNGLGLQLFNMSKNPFGPLAPGKLTSATLLCQLESPTSVELGTTPLANPGTAPVITLSGNLLQAVGILVTVTTGGNQLAAKIKISIDSGVSTLESNVSTIGTHAIGLTGANLVFPALGTYALGTTYTGVCFKLHDLTTGANDFSNVTNGQRPFVIVNGIVGVPDERWDGSNDILNCVTALSDTLAGAGINTPFAAMFLVNINALPSGANIGTIFTAGNTGSLARVELQLTSTAIRCRRHSDAGGDSTLTSIIPATGGLYLMDWRFDGTKSRVAMMGADVIGGRSEVNGTNSLAGALTLNNVSLGAQKTSAGSSNFASIDFIGAAFFSGAPSDLEWSRLRQYYAQKFGFKIFRNQDVVGAVTFFGGATKGTAAEHWMNYSPTPGLMLPLDDSNTNNTSFGYRQPLRADGTTAYWYYQNTGSPANELDIVREHIDFLADSGVKLVVVLFYPIASLITASNQGTPAQAVIWHWFEIYQQCPNKNRLKFAIMCESVRASFDTNSGVQPQFPQLPGTYLNLSAFANYFADLMLDPEYFKDLNGNPIFYPFEDANTPWTVAHLAVITSAAQARGFANVTYINPNESGAAAGAFGEQLTSYGPSGAQPAGAGQLSAQSQTNKDRANWVVSLGIKKQLGITVRNDGRVVRGTATWWVDRHTYSEYETHFEQTFAYARMTRNQVPDQVIEAYSAGEWAEGGDFFWTRQTKARGVNSPTRGILLDAWYNVAHESYPTELWDSYHAASKNTDITHVGTWTLVIGVSNGGGSNDAPFEFAEFRNSTGGNTLTFSPRYPCDAIRFYYPKGPIYGTLNVSLDGGAPTVIVQTDATYSYNNFIEFSALVVALHSVVVTNVSGTISGSEFRSHRVRPPVP